MTNYPMNREAIEARCNVALQTYTRQQTEQKLARIGRYVGVYQSSDALISRRYRAVCKSGYMFGGRQCRALCARGELMCGQCADAVIVADQQSTDSGGMARIVAQGMMLVSAVVVVAVCAAVQL